MQTVDILIVGSGHAGAQAATLLRQHGYDGSIALLGEEPHPPYERPPLSKEYLAGEKSFEGLLIRPASFWDEQEIVLLPNRRVVSVDPQAHTVTCHDGEHISYRRLIWAAGGTPHKLGCPGSDAPGVHSIRNLKDIDAIMTKLGSISDVAIVGGGYIGLEAAAAFRKLGKTVTLVETQNRVLKRVAGEVVSRFYEVEHRAHGVHLHIGASIAAIKVANGRAVGISLVDGRTIRADLVIVGIGILPSVEPLIVAGASGADGVDIDTTCRTSLPDIWAIGDCAAHVNTFAGGRRIRLESVQNANDQARIAILDLLGEPEAYHSLPWFWSDQYDLKLQTAGISTGYDQEIVRGDPSQRTFSVMYLRDGKIAAIDCINNPRGFLQSRSQIGKEFDGG